MGPLLEAFASFLGKLLADEAEAWMPWLAIRLTSAAVSVLPAEQQGRYREEWCSHLEEVPGRVGKLVTAFGFLKAACLVSNRFALRRLLERCAAVAFFIFFAPTFLIIYISIKVLTGNRPIVAVSGSINDGIRAFACQFFVFNIRRAATNPYVVLHAYPRMTPLTLGEGAQLDRYIGNADASYLGNFLRRSGMVSLPLIFNVIRGDVGFKDLRHGRVANVGVRI